MQVKITDDAANALALTLSVIPIAVCIIMDGHAVWMPFAAVGIYVFLAAAGFLNGTCTADEEGVRIKYRFSEKMIPYDEIMWAYTDLSVGGGSRGSRTRSLIHKLKIVTGDRTIEIKATNGFVSDSRELMDPKLRELMIRSSVFAGIEQYIKERINTEYQGW